MAQKKAPARVTGADGVAGKARAVGDGKRVQRERSSLDSIEGVRGPRTLRKAEGRVKVSGFWIIKAPKLIWICATVPSNMSRHSRATTSKALCRKSIGLGTPVTRRHGVTLWKSSGIGLTFTVMFPAAICAGTPRLSATVAYLRFRHARQVNSGQSQPNVPAVTRA